MTNTLSLTHREKVLGFVYLPVDLLVLPTALLLLFPGASGPQQNFCYFSINFIACILIFHRLLGLSLRPIVQSPFRFFWIVLLGLAGYQSMSMLLGDLILRLAPEFYNVNDSGILQLLAQDRLLITVGTVLLVPLAEECLHRGLVFGFLAQKSLPLAYALSTALFSVIHMMGYIGTYPAWMLLVGLLQYVPAGICLAWAYEKSGSLFAPICIHMMVNALGVYATR